MEFLGNVIRGFFWQIVAAVTVVAVLVGASLLQPRGDAAVDLATDEVVTVRSTVTVAPTRATTRAFRTYPSAYAPSTFAAPPVGPSAPAPTVPTELTTAAPTLDTAEATPSIFTTEPTPTPKPPPVPDPVPVSTVEETTELEVALATEDAEPTDITTYSEEATTAEATPEPTEDEPEPTLEVSSVTGPYSDYSNPISPNDHPNTTAAKNFVFATWPEIDTIGTWRAQGSVPNSDHPKGLALDIMTSDYALGTEIANWFENNPDIFGTKYVLWQVANHYDHVHVSLNPV